MEGRCFGHLPCVYIYKEWAGLGGNLSSHLSCESEGLRERESDSLFDLFAIQFSDVARSGLQPDLVK